MNGFQRRSRRANRAGHVDLPCPAFVEIVRRTDPRQHLAAFVVDGDDRDQYRSALAQWHGRAPALPVPSAISIQRQLDDRCPCMSRGRRRRNAAPKSGSTCALRHWRRLGLQRVVFRNHAVFNHTIQHADRAPRARLADDGRPAAVPATAAAPPGALTPPATRRLGSLPK